MKIYLIAPKFQTLFHWSMILGFLGKKDSYKVNVLHCHCFTFYNRTSLIANSCANCTAGPLSMFLKLEVFVRKCG